jgi:excisionase family DNA binding protein
MTADYLTPPEIARRYRVKPSKVVRWIKSGELVGVDVADRGSKRPRFRVSPEALEKFLAARSTRKPEQVARRRRTPEPLVDYFPAKPAKVPV